MRSFFRYAEQRGWCALGIAAGIAGPRVFKDEGLPVGPDWADVQRLIGDARGDCTRDIRDTTILMLFAIYGFRSGEQLAENRRARQRRNGAVYLLQGLTVCGHCHYAYYGKKVSNASTKGQRRNYAYYRCIGTDAYRFGGERVCDNQQIRTDRLDELVWQQVAELLAHPGRLKNEYERRLGILEEKEKTNPDTAALERQRLQLEKGKSRLIDSYAEGMIEKTDFDPKMRHLKSRLEQIDQQIQESRHHQVGQHELFLVINRLEEFAAAVLDRLDTVDFLTKREIIRGLVKRVEIHKDEILVVFRVDPDPGFNASESSAGSDAREKSMQDRTRRNRRPLRRALLRGNPLSIFENACAQPSSDQR